MTLTKELLLIIGSLIKKRIDECQLEEDAFWEMDRSTRHISRRRFMLLEINKECIVLVCFFDEGQDKCAWLKTKDNWILVYTQHTNHIGATTTGDFVKHLNDAYTALSFDKVLKE
jgi:hypothetical protein